MIRRQTMKQKITAYCFILLFGMLPSIALAQPDSQLDSASALTLKQAKIPSESVLTQSLSGTDLLELIFGLLFVLATIVVVVWLIKRIGRLNHTSNKQMHIVAAMNLGAREKIILIQVGEQQILIGATPTSINKLHILDQPLIEPDPVEPFSQALSEKLKNFLGKRQ